MKILSSKTTKTICVKDVYVFIILLALIFTSCLKLPSRMYTIVLNRDWKFEYEGKWYSAEVPGVIHTDLIKHGIIQDPFYRDNEQDVQWVSERNWVYKTTFDLTSIAFIHGIQLVFEGLDTYANVYVNGTLLKCEDSEFSASNMFREWRYDLPSNTKMGKNELVVEFFPSASIDSKEAAKLNYQLPDERVFTRKAPYQSGWDWGPVLPTCGIWKPAYIEPYQYFMIDDFQVYTESITKEKAIISLKTEVISGVVDKFQIYAYINGKKVISEKKLIKPGKNIIEHQLEIDDPQLWWPNGFGEQNLYDVSIEIEYVDRFDAASRRIGLRTIELVTDEDEIGSKFEFHVNGVPIFMKGANYIPSESFPIKRSKESHYQLIKDCKNSNFNMLRIWGGGIYEDNEFYNACDELGILVWQDFMFACALYPGDEAFLKNVEGEVVQQVLRLRNHPSIALWCGNNEVKNGWEDWGWQNDYTPEQREQIYAAYEAVFHEIIPNVIEEYDPNTPYHASSPLWGWGHKESCTEGDSHYWGVWWGELPFEIWKEKTGRFMSEFGFQSYPSFNSVKNFTVEEDWDINSAVMKNHQKHGRGIEIITNYMDRYFGVPKTFEDYLYVSQLLQAYGVGNALETHRISQPHCMGTLYWQINDCWPVASWSSIDYYGDKKALYYTAKNIFEELIVASEIQNDTLVVYLVSDLRKDLQGKLIIDFKDFDGNFLEREIVDSVTAKANTSTCVYHYLLNESIVKRANDAFVLLSFVSDDKTVKAEKVQYMAYPKYLKLSDSEINFVVEKNKNYYTITIASNVLSKGIYVNSSVKGDFSDNYFDLLPNSEKIITFTPQNKAKDKSQPIFEIKSYLNAF